jgi:hypothetical protein
MILLKNTCLGEGMFIQEHTDCLTVLIELFGHATLAHSSPLTAAAKIEANLPHFSPMCKPKQAMSGSRSARTPRSSSGWRSNTVMIAALYLHSKQRSAQVERQYYACYKTERCVEQRAQRDTSRCRMMRVISQSGVCSKWFLITHGAHRRAKVHIIYGQRTKS